MNSKLIRKIAVNLETILIVGIFVFYSGSVTVAPQIEKLIKVGSYGILLILIALSWKRFAYVLTRDKLILTLLSIAVMSFFWSAAPDFTLNEVKSVVRATFLGVYMAMRYSTKEQIQLLIYSLITIAILSLITYIVSPGTGSHIANGVLAWRGIYRHKNHLGRIMALSPLFLAFSISKRHSLWKTLVIFGLMFALIILSQSKTALILFVSLSSVLVLYKIAKQHYKIKAILAILTILVVGSTSILIVTNLEYVLVDVLGKDLGLNGRVPIWTLSIEKGLERPWFGYGFAAFWTSEESLYVTDNSWALSDAKATGDVNRRFNAHNGYLDIFLQLGFAGFFLYLTMYFTVLWRTLNLFFLTRRIEVICMIQILVMQFIVNFSVGNTILTSDIIWIYFISINLISSRERKEIALANRYRPQKILSIPAES